MQGLLKPGETYHLLHMALGQTIKSTDQNISVLIMSSNFYFHMLLFSHFIAKKCLALQNIKGRITICMIIR